MEAPVEQIAPIASIVLSLAGMVLAWSLTRNVRGVDDTIKKLQADTSKMQERVGELEKHEVVNALKEQIGQRFDGLQDVLGKMRTDIEVLKDRDRDGRASDRPSRRRGGK